MPSVSFVNFFLKKKQQKIKKIKLFFIIIFIFIFVFIVCHISSVFVLKNETIKILNSFNKDNTQVKYQIYSNIFKGDIVVKNIDFKVSNGKASCDSIKIKKTSGIFFPNEINLKIDGVMTTIANSNKNYIISKKGNKNGFYIKLNRSFFKASFGGIRNSSPVIYYIMDDKKSVGEIKIDNFIIAVDGDKKETMYKGSMIFHDTVFLPYVFLLDTPFSWDVHLQEFKTKDYVGFNKNNLVDLNNVKIKRFFMDFDFSKLYINGFLNYTSGRLNNVNVEFDIDNDQKLIDNMFNMALRNRSDTMQQIKKFHFSIKKIIFFLKENNENSTDKHLQLVVKKSGMMPDFTINDVSLTDLVAKISKSM